MTIEDFLAEAPDEACSDALKALWHEAKGDWDHAHELVQANSPDDCWVHAYLHRKEGDLSNASYWYGRAGKPDFDGTLEEEWLAIAGDLLNRAVDGA